MVDRHNIINRFFQTISWQEECTVELINNIPHVVYNPDKTLLLPIQHTEFGNILSGTNDSLFKSLLQYQDGKRGLIVDGNIDRSGVEIICIVGGMEKYSYTPFFVAPATRINYGRFVASVLDGVDWERSLEAIASSKDDENVQPIFEWD